MGKGKPNGTLPLKLGWFKTYHVTGGPYRNKPNAMIGVKLAPEIRAPAFISLDAPDFGLFKPAECEAAAADTLQLIANGVPVYAGCFGGIGRTGTFLAILAKAAGHDDAVAYVRKHYIPEAVETEEQESFVEEFDVTRLRAMLKRWRWERLAGWIPSWLLPRRCSA